MQDHLNLLYREEEREMLPFCQDQKIAVIPWSPLARGRLTRDWDEKTMRSETDEFGKTLYNQAEDADRAIIGIVGELAQEARRFPRPDRHRLDPAEKRRHRPDHRRLQAKPPRDAVGALSVKLAPEDVAALEQPYVPVSSFDGNIDF
jgi:hypothetical protein